MREPEIGTSVSDQVPYSKAPERMLKAVVAETVRRGCGIPHYDKEFRRWWAATLLKERGA